MSHNYAREFNKWIVWKENEEALLRKLGVNEQIVQELRQYDWNVFKKERSFRRRQFVTIDTFFLNIPYEDTKDIYEISDLLDEIDNEELYDYLKSLDKVTQTIILFKILGYSTSDIAKILRLSEAAVRNRISRMRKKFKKFMNSDTK